MKTYHLSFLVETDDNTDYQSIGVFTDLKTAQKEYKKAVKEAPRYKQSNDNEFKEYLNESIVLELYVNDDFEETISQQIIYKECTIDRMNWKGNRAINYYSRATFDGKELMYKMYFQGDYEMWGKKRKVKESELSKWYYR